MNKLRFNVIGFVSICAIAGLSAAEKPLFNDPLANTIVDAGRDVKAHIFRVQQLQTEIASNPDISFSSQAEFARLAQKSSDHGLQAHVHWNIALESYADQKDPNSRANAQAFLGDAARSLNARPTIKDIQQKYDDESSKAQARAVQFQKEQDNS